MKTLFYHFLKLLFFIVGVFFEKGSLYLPLNWSWTYQVAQSGLEFMFFLPLPAGYYHYKVTQTHSAWNMLFCFALFAIQTSHTPHKQSPSQSHNAVASTEHTDRSSSASSLSKLWFTLGTMHSCLNKQKWHGLTITILYRAV